MIGRVALGADHAGFALKEEMIAWLKERTYQVLDMGAHNFDPADDYPDFAEAVSQAVVSGKAQRGVIICGSGVGACIAANKVPGVRACMCHDTYSAHQGVEHDDMNVVCLLGERVVGLELAKEIVDAFLNAQFTGEERHRRRVDKILSIERKALEGNLATKGGEA